MLYDFHYLAPRSREVLLALLADHGPAARLLAGGTDLLPNIRSAVTAPALVIDLKRVPGYELIGFDKAKGAVFGPAVTINQLLEHKELCAAYPVLQQTGSQLASHQLRNRATVVGNIANASPCADMAPALLCLEATVVISSRDGSRTLPVKEFFTGVKKTVLAPGELVERIEIPAASAGFPAGYKKLKRIKGHDLGIVGVALVRTPAAIRIAVSSAAPTPVLVPDLPATATAAQVKEATLKAISPIDDIRGTRDYRLFMVGEYVERLLEEVR